MDQFAKDYFNLLTGEYAGINLTRINEYDDFYNKQIIDSIAPSDQVEIFEQAILEKKLMVDIGFGGGFPILPMAKKYPDLNFVGIETRGKKVKVVGEIAQKLGLKNVQLNHKRIENVLLDRPCVCTFKAVGKVNDFLNKINTTEKIQVYFYKGPNFYTLEKEQIKEAQKSWNIIVEQEISGVEGAEKRLLIGFENKNVPHGTRNNLVKLSELL